MFIDNEIANTPQDISNLFADFFHSVFKPPFDPPLTCNTSYNPNPILTSFDFSLEDLQKCFSQMGNSGNPGSDGVPEKIIKLCSPSLTLPLFILFKSSFNLGYFPNTWKEALILAIYKSGNKDDISNYRGVTIICGMAKLFDSLLYNILYDKVSHLISPHQHGFVRGKSVETGLFCFTDEVTQSVVNGSQTDVVYFDFSKAFDSVDHKLLFSKLYNLGIRGWALKWLISYLNNRSLKVSFNGTLSKKFFVRSSPGLSYRSSIILIIYK